MSVIIPTYNRAALVREAIESVLDQTYCDYEIIVVDDGSTDNTREVVCGLSDKLRYVFQGNHGRSSARNEGIRLATGRYIAFLDDDDLYLPCKLEKQVALLDERPGFGMVYTSALCIDEHGKRLPHTYRATDSGWIYDKVAFYVPLTILLPTVMVRAEVLRDVGAFDETMERFEDTDMWRRVARRYPILALNEALCLVRTHPGNAMYNQDPETIVRYVLQYIDKAFEEDSEVSKNLRRRGAARFCFVYGYALIQQSECRRLGRQLLAASVRHWPLQPFGYLGILLTYMPKSSLLFALLRHWKVCRILDAWPALRSWTRKRGFRFREGMGPGV